MVCNKSKLHSSIFGINIICRYYYLLKWGRGRIWMIWQHGYAFTLWIDYLTKNNLWICLHYLQFNYGITGVSIFYRNGYLFLTVDKGCKNKTSSFTLNSPCGLTLYHATIWKTYILLLFSFAHVVYLQGHKDCVKIWLVEGLIVLNSILHACFCNV